MSDTTSSERRRPSQKTKAISAASAVAAIAIVVVSILTGGHVTANGGQPTSALVGKSVASFSLDGLNGGTVVAPWKSHHAAVVIFFASWCGPCKSEMPQVASYLRHHNEGSIHVIGMDAGDSLGPAKSFVQSSGVAFPVAFDPSSTVTNDTFHFATVPETVFVSAKGIVVQVYFGAIPKSVLVTGLANLRANAGAA